jgi:hypothetical protein
MFVEDVIDKEFLSTVLLNQAEQVAQRLRSGGLEGKTITLKFESSDLRFRNKRPQPRFAWVMLPN